MKKILLILTLALFVTLPALAATQTLIPNASKIEFEAIGRPSMMKVKGTGAGAKGQLNIEGGQVTGKMTVAVSELKTGIDLRDEHMKEKYLHAKDHPEATLSLNPIAVPSDWKLGTPLQQKFTGKLKLHGVEKDIEGDFNLAADKSVSAKFDIKLSDFKIDIPSYLGVTIADKVKVKADFALKEK